MKKIFALAATAIFIMTSCSKDDAAQPINNVNTGILLKKAIVTVNDEEPVTADYTYDGNRLTTINYSDGRSETYTYENDRLGKIRQFNNNVLVKLIDLDFTSGNTGQASITTYTDEAIIRETRTFGVDIEGKIISHEYVDNIYTKRKVITAYGSNVSYIRVYEGEVEYSLENTSYTYDVKNNPFRNIQNNKELALFMQNGRGANNSISYYHSNMGVTESSETQYTYNENNFPITSTETKSNDDVITTQYFYE